LPRSARTAAVLGAQPNYKWGGGDALRAGFEAEIDEPHAFPLRKDYNRPMNFLQLGDYYFNLAQIRYVYEDTTANTVKVWFVGSDEPLHLTGPNGKAFLHHLGAKDAGRVNT
jgi:hypothetical protein